MSITFLESKTPGLMKVQSPFKVLPCSAKDLLQIFAFVLISDTNFLSFKIVGISGFFIIIKGFENGPIGLYWEQWIIQLFCKILVVQSFGGID